MYNFFLGSRDDIEADPRTFLVAIKRMLPRWANSLPDSEFHALIDLIESQDHARPPVFVETGAGASTIVFIHYAMQHGGRVLSWDLNPSKGSFIHGVCGETLAAHHGKSVSSHWTFVSSGSLSPHTGMEVLGELVDRVDLSFHDSDHTWETTKGEVEAVLPLMEDGAIVCIDDANQGYRHIYEPLVNMTRKKIGLPPIDAIADNRTEPLYDNVPRLLRRYFERIDEMNEPFRSRLEDDLYYTWYNVDRRRMSEMGMEKFADVRNRFAAWKLSGRIAPAG